VTSSACRKFAENDLKMARRGRRALGETFKPSVAVQRAQINVYCFPEKTRTTRCPVGTNQGQISSGTQASNCSSTHAPNGALKPCTGFYSRLTSKSSIDVNFGEDACRVRDENVQQTLNGLRKTVNNSLNAYKANANLKTPISQLLFDNLLDRRNILKAVRSKKLQN